jgi:hypothetical protein
MTESSIALGYCNVHVLFVWALWPPIVTLWQVLLTTYFVWLGAHRRSRAPSILIEVIERGVSRLGAKEVSI